jgi:drug/metabolite transporter (DMT)-like permease
MEGKKKKYLSDLSLLFVAFAWGGGFVVVKDTLDSMTPMYIMAFRFVLATIVVYLALHRWMGKIEKKDLLKGSVVGVFLYLAFAFQTVGLQYTTASKQGFLTATYVVMVPLIFMILYRRIPRMKVFAASILTITGIALMVLDGGLTFNQGDLLTLICAFFFALHIISIEYFAKNMHVFKLAFIQIAVAALLFVVSALIAEPVPEEITARSWGAIVYMGVVSTFACFTIQTVAQKHTPSSHVSIIMSLEAVFATLLGVLLLSEVFTMDMVVGASLIFAAILIIELWGVKNNPSSIKT